MKAPLRKRQARFLQKRAKRATLRRGINTKSRYLFKTSRGEATETRAEYQLKIPLTRYLEVEVMQKSSSLAKGILGDKISSKLKYRKSLERYSSEYLKQKGWDKTVYGNQSVDAQGPIPWITYPALKVLDRIVLPEWRVFEYGCGNSSLWWSKRVSFVASVEDDEYWADQVKRKAPSNLQVTLRQIDETPDPNLSQHAHEFFQDNPKLPTSGEFVSDMEGGLLNKEYIAYGVEIARFEKGHFDVVVVDGMCRSLSAYMAAKFVSENGIIVFDNSDRWQYETGYAALEKFGFKRIDFYGTGPVNPFEWCTSIFCRNLAFLPSDNRIPHTLSDLGW